MIKPLLFVACAGWAGAAYGQVTTFKKTDRYYFYEQCKRMLGERLTDIELICGTCAETAEMFVSDFTPEQTKRMSPTEIQGLIASMETKMRIIQKKPTTQTDNRPLPADDDHTAPLPAKQPQPTVANLNSKWAGTYTDNYATSSQTLTISDITANRMSFSLSIGSEDCSGETGKQIAQATSPVSYQFKKGTCHIVLSLREKTRSVSYFEVGCDEFRGNECFFSGEAFKK